jgi:hypothetical protein
MKETELHLLHRVVRAAITMRQKFGDEYEGRFAELDAALDAWSTFHTMPSPTSSTDPEAK